MPAGIGMPSTIPIGTSVATATAMRTGRENGIAHVMNGATVTIASRPSATITRIATAVLRRSVSGREPSAEAAPMPVPSRSEKSVTVSEYTG